MEYNPCSGEASNVSHSSSRLTQGSQHSKLSPETLSDMEEEEARDSSDSTEDENPDDTWGKWPFVSAHDGKYAKTSCHTVWSGTVKEAREDSEDERSREHYNIILPRGTLLDSTDFFTRLVIGKSPLCLSDTYKKLDKPFRRFSVIDLRSPARAENIPNLAAQTELWKGEEAAVQADCLVGFSPEPGPVVGVQDLSTGSSQYQLLQDTSWFVKVHSNQKTIQTIRVLAGSTFKGNTLEGEWVSTSEPCLSDVNLNEIQLSDLYFGGGSKGGMTFGPTYHSSDKPISCVFMNLREHAELTNIDRTRLCHKLTEFEAELTLRQGRLEELESLEQSETKNTAMVQVLQQRSDVKSDLASLNDILQVGLKWSS